MNDDYPEGAKTDPKAQFNERDTFSHLYLGCDQDKITETINQTVSEEDREEALLSASESAPLCKWCNAD